MAWPSTLASRITSGYIHRTYTVNALTLRQDDPPMKTLPFYNANASDGIKEVDIQLFVGGLLKFFAQLSIPLKPGKETGGAMTELVEAILNPNGRSSKIVSIIDDYYKFRDEEAT